MPNGVFWTVAVPASAVTTNLRKGTARFKASNLPVRDSRHLLNAVAVEGPSERATASFDITWSKPVTRFDVSDAEYGFGGSFIEAVPAIEFSVEGADFAFTSAPAAQSVPIFGVIGYERNGAYFT